MRSRRLSAEQLCRESVCCSPSDQSEVTANAPGKKGVLHVCGFPASGGHFGKYEIPNELGYGMVTEAQPCLES